MHIRFSPLRSDAQLTVSKQGDCLILNGEVFDFSALPDGATLPAEAVQSDWLVGDVERVDGMLHLTLARPHGANASQASLFPAPVTLTEDGPVSL